MHMIEKILDEIIALNLGMKIEGEVQKMDELMKVFNYGGKTLEQLLKMGNLGLLQKMFVKFWVYQM